MSFQTTVFKYKCRACNLHFALYTQKRDGWLNRSPHCPECNNNDKDKFVAWSEEINIPIFALVPGESKTLGSNRANNQSKYPLLARLIDIAAVLLIIVFLWNVVQYFVRPSGNASYLQEACPDCDQF